MHRVSRPRRRSVDHDRRVAFHEAGHAVACVATGSAFGVTALHDPPLDGAVGAVHDVDAPSHHAQALILLAGGLAEAHSGEYLRDGTAWDLGMLWAALPTLAVELGEDITPAVLERLFAEAGEIVTTHLGAVRSIAAALLLRRELSAPEVRLLIRSASPAPLAVAI